MINGYHKVKSFEYVKSGELRLPRGWKPFAFVQSGPYSRSYVICRYWVRDEVDDEGSS